MTSQPSTPADPGFLTGEVLQQNYYIKTLLGEGGMAYVYRATHRVLGGDVAIKVLQRRYAQRDDFRERFLREARLQYQLHHPNIVRVLDFIEDRGLVGCVQELCDGGELILPATGGELPIDLIKEHFFPLLDALGEVHRKGYIHRDIKPQNILMQRQSERGDCLWKLSDFGLLKDPGAEQITQSGAILGTFHYISPEQFQESKEVDCRTDIYSLGVVLYQLLLGRVPFPSKMPRLAMQIMEAPVPFPVDFPTPLKAVLKRALAKTPENRFADCLALKRALSAAFDEYQGQAPVVSSPAPLLTFDSPSKPAVLGHERTESRAGECVLPMPKAPLELTPEPLSAFFVEDAKGESLVLEAPPADEARSTAPPLRTSRARRILVGLGVLLGIGVLVMVGWWQRQKNSPTTADAQLITTQFAAVAKRRLAELLKLKTILYSALFARQNNWGNTRYHLRLNCKQHGDLCDVYAHWVDATLRIWEIGCRSGDRTSCDWHRRGRQRRWRRHKFHLRAIPLYQRACQQGKAMACFWLGASRAGAGRPWSPTPQQRQWLRRGCQLKHGRSCLFLGHWHRHQPNPKALRLASSWFAKACQHADVTGCLLWGQTLRKQQGLSQDARRKLAAEAFARACKLHSRLGCHLQKQR